MKKLYRSKTNKSIAGVCAGLAQYLNVDVTIVRVLWVLISVLSASVPGLLIYIVCMFIIPEEPDGVDSTAYYTDDSTQNDTNNGNTDFYYNSK